MIDMPESQPVPHLAVHRLYMLLLSLNSLFSLLSGLSLGLSLLLSLKQLLLLLSLRLNVGLSMHFGQRLLGTLLRSLHTGRLVLKDVLLLQSRCHVRMLRLRHVLRIRVLHLLMRMLRLSRLRLMRMCLMALGRTRYGSGSL